MRRNCSHLPQNPTVAVRARVTLIAAIATPSEPLGATGSRLGTRRGDEGPGTWTRHGDGGVSGPISQGYSRARHARGGKQTRD